jgi:hypothetical protein
MLECARYNAVQARKAASDGKQLMADYRRRVAAECRHDANELRRTAR